MYNTQPGSETEIPVYRALKQEATMNICAILSSAVISTLTASFVIAQPARDLVMLQNWPAPLYRLPICNRAGLSMVEVQ